MAFLIGQRAFIKMYAVTLIEQHVTYGTELIEKMRQMLKEEGYVPPQSEVYRGLEELVRDGIIYGTKTSTLLGEFQQVVAYRFTEEGYELAQQWKKEMYWELKRSQGMLKLADQENFL